LTCTFLAILLFASPTVLQDEGPDHAPYSDSESSGSELDPDEPSHYKSKGLKARAVLGLAEGLGGTSDSDEDEEDYSEGASDDGRIQEIRNEAELLVEEAKAAESTATAGSKKRPAVEEAGEDVSMADAAEAAGLEGVDRTKLSKSQRKKLAKKLKAANGDAIAPPASAPPAGTTASAAAPKTDDKKNAKADDKPASAPAPSKPGSKAASADGASAKATTTLPSGLKMMDTKLGTGASAKAGQKVAMRYIGKLQATGKVFDKNTSGEPFRFTLGKGEVIKGWDEGVVGLKVGGERKLVVPPALAYGKRGAPPDIPPNATLAFEVKRLK